MEKVIKVKKKEGNEGKVDVGVRQKTKQNTRKPLKKWDGEIGKKKKRILK